MRDVVVTGLGCVTPMGPGAREGFRALLAGRSGIRTISRFDASGFSTTFAAEVDEVPALGGPFLRAATAALERDLWDRKTELLLAAAQEALGPLDDGPSPIGRIGPPQRVGLCLGSEGGRRLLEDLAVRALRHGADPDLLAAALDLPRGEYARMRPSHPLRVLANALGLRGPTRTVCTACTSSAGAVVEATRLLGRGEVDLVVAAGTDTLVEAFMVSGFSLLGALSTRNDAPALASRPFDRDRDGLVLGEGAGVLLLEGEEHARARGARVLGRVLGAGMSNNAYRITDSPPDGTGPMLAMGNALRDAGLGPEQVVHVNAHGTSTAMNDASESRGIRRALGEHAGAVSVTSNKGAMGHLVAACGVVEAIFSLLSLEAGLIPPTLNLQHQDPECDIDVVSGAPRAFDPAGRVVLSNSFGFGGSNATLALGSARA
jgi:3-oxoacyl-[acyl-carrier-protein] synthase II